MFLTRTYNTGGPPRGEFTLNKSSPLYDGSLALALAPFLGHGFENLAPGGITATPTDYKDNTIGVYGRKYERSNAGGYVTLNPTISISNGYTVSIVFDTLQLTENAIAAYNETNFDVHLMRNSTSSTLGVFDTGQRAFSPVVWPTIFPAWITVTYDGTTAHCYLNGIEAGSVAASLAEDIATILGDNDQSRAWRTCLRMEIWTRPLSPAEVLFHHGLSTCWDFYWQPSNKLYSFPVVAAPPGGRIMSSLAYQGGLAGPGGIAGPGGGLAG